MGIVLLWLFCVSGWQLSLSKVSEQRPSAELSRMSNEDLPCASVSNFAQRLAGAPASVNTVTSDDIAKYSTAPANLNRYFAAL